MYQLSVGLVGKLLYEKMKWIYSSLVASVSDCFPAGSVSTDDGLHFITCLLLPVFERLCLACRTCDAGFPIGKSSL